MLKKVTLTIGLLLLSLFIVLQLVRTTTNLIGIFDEITPTNANAETNDSLVVSIETVEPEPTPTPLPGNQVLVSAADGFIPDNLIIDKFSLNLPVRYVPLVDGTWEVFPATANFAEGTSYVNSENGNVGVYGHDRSNALHAIKDLTIGDHFVFVGDDLRADYVVSEVFTTVPEDVDVFAATTTPVATLITCAGNFSEVRYIVRGQLVSITSEQND